MSESVLAHNVGVADLVYVPMQKVRLVRRRDAGAVASLPVLRSNVAADNSPASSSWLARRAESRALHQAAVSATERAAENRSRCRLRPPRPQVRDDRQQLRPDRAGAA